MTCFFLLLLVLCSCCSSICPCSDQSLCHPITTQYKTEVFGFGQSDYETYDWNLVTTIAWASDPAVMCKAHAAKARVIAGAPGDMPLSSDNATRAAWIQHAITYVKANYLDGKLGPLVIS